MTGDDRQPPGHVSDIELAAFLDGGLSREEHRRVEEHLSECTACRTDFTEAAVVTPRTGRFPRLAAAGGIAAAAILLLMVGWPGRGSEDVAVEHPVRAVATEEVLVVHGPIGEAEAQQFRFVWRGIPEVVTYRVTLSGDDAAPIWSESTGDTILTLPDSVMLRRGQRYYWVVDAVREDGTTRTSGVREFLAAP